MHIGNMLLDHQKAMRKIGDCAEIKKILKFKYVKILTLQFFVSNRDLRTLLED